RRCAPGRPNQVSSSPNGCPSPATDLVSRQPQSSLLARHPFVHATPCCIPIHGSGSVPSPPPPSTHRHRPVNPLRAHKIANVLSALPKSAHPGAKKALAEIWNAEDREHARRAVAAFKLAYGAKFAKAVAKVTDDLDELLAFYDYPAEHWIHLRTTNPIESTFATVRHRTKATKGPASQAAGLATALKRMDASPPPAPSGTPTGCPRTRHSRTRPRSQRCRADRPRTHRSPVAARNAETPHAPCPTWPSTPSAPHRQPPARSTAQRSPGTPCGPTV